MIAISEKQTTGTANRTMLINGVLLVLLLLGFGLAFWQVRGYEADITRQTFTIHGSVDTPALLLSPHARRGNTIAIIVHGTAANKELMLSVGVDLARQGIPTYLFDLPGHGQSPATLANSDQLAGAVNDVFTYARQHSAVANPQFILVGYSLGTIIVRDYIESYTSQGYVNLNADAPNIAATILISPEIDTGYGNLVGNVLFLAGGFDLPGLRDQARSEIADLCTQSIPSNATRFDCVNPARGNDYEFFVAPLANHISMVTDAGVIGAIDRWATMSAQIPASPNTSNSRIIWLVVGLLCAFIALFPLFRLGLALLPSQDTASGATAQRPIPLWSRILIFAASLVVGNALLYAWSRVADQTNHPQWLTPLSPIGIAWADYLASNGLVVGALCLGVFAIWRRRMPALTRDGVAVQVAISGVLFLFAYATIGTLLSFGWENLLLNQRRFLAGIPLTLAAAPLFFAIETLLADRKTWQILVGRVSAYGLLLIAEVAVVLVDNRLAFLLIIMPVQVVIYLLLVIQSSLMQRSGKFIGFAVAVFASLAFGWIIAAVFPFYQY